MSFTLPISAFRRLNINTFFDLSLLLVEISGMWQTDLAPVPMTEPLDLLSVLAFITIHKLLDSGSGDPYPITTYPYSERFTLIEILQFVFLFALLGSLSVLATLRLAMIFKYYRQKIKAGVSFDLPSSAKPSEQPPGALEILLGRSIWRAHFRCVTFEAPSLNGAEFFPLQK